MDDVSPRPPCLPCPPRCPGPPHSPRPSRPLRPPRCTIFHRDQNLHHPPAPPAFSSRGRTFASNRTLSLDRRAESATWSAEDFDDENYKSVHKCAFLIAIISFRYI